MEEIVIKFLGLGWMEVDDEDDELMGWLGIGIGLPPRIDKKELTQNEHGHPIF